MQQLLIFILTFKIFTVKPTLLEYFLYISLQHLHQPLYLHLSLPLFSLYFINHLPFSSTIYIFILRSYRCYPLSFSIRIHFIFYVLCHNPNSFHIFSSAELDLYLVLGFTFFLIFRLSVFLPQALFAFSPFIFTLDSGQINLFISDDLIH